LGGIEVDAQRMQQNLALTGPLIVAERLALVLGPRLGAGRVKELVDRGAAGADLAVLLREEPGLVDLDLSALLDPNGYTGAAAELIDAALAAAEQGRP
ncbi:MAG: adenylosuccinate lyase, partial [Leifsonia sp.]